MIVIICDRCEGVMVHEKFFGNQGSFWGWRCVRCGEVIDEVILENRGWGMGTEIVKSIRERR